MHSGDEHACGGGGVRAIPVCKIFTGLQLFHFYSVLSWDHFYQEDITSENKDLGHFIIQHESQFSEINKWVKKALVTSFHSSASFMKKPSETNKSLSGQVESSYHQEFVILKDFIRGQLVSQGCIYFKSAYFPPIRRDPPRSNFSSIFFLFDRFVRI